MIEPAGLASSFEIGGGLRLRSLLLLALPIFVAHVLEEAPDFVDWFNQHVAGGITQDMFWAVNITLLVITFLVALLEWLSESRESTALVVAWLSFLMFANGLAHIVATIADRAYAPGVVTAALLYLPFYAIVIARVRRAHRLTSAALLTAAAVGALPMLVHGYLIIFRGSRLF